MSVHEMTSKCINIDFRFNVPCTLFRQKGVQILCFRGNFYCSVTPKLVEEYVNAEMEEDSEEYRWAMEKANWIRDSEKHPDELLMEKEKSELLNIKLID